MVTTKGQVGIATVQKPIEHLVRIKNLKPQNYLFRIYGNHKAYLDKFIYDEKGRVKDIITTGERYRPDGTEREVTPMCVGSVTRWLKTEAAKFNIIGHYSSHAMRQTFSYFISVAMGKVEEELNVIAASMALGHVNFETILQHYLKCSPQKIREEWLNFKLGKEVVDLFCD